MGQKKSKVAPPDTGKDSVTKKKNVQNSKKNENNNVRVNPNRSTPNTPREYPPSMIKTIPTELPSSVEPDDMDAMQDIFDRRAFKDKRKNISVSNTTNKDNNKTEKDNSSSEEEEEEETQKKLRTGPKTFGSAKQNEKGFYSVNVVVKDWRFTENELTVPLGCVVSFSVDKKERSMVEVTVSINNNNNEHVATSFCLTAAGPKWEYFCNEIGEFSFCDINDEDDSMKGTILIVDGDERTVLACNESKIYEKRKMDQAASKKKQQQIRDAEKFEKELKQMSEEMIKEDEEILLYSELTLKESESQPDLDEARQKAVADSLAMYQQMKR